MTATFWVVLGLLAIGGWHLSFSASRLDRLHHRVETSWATLDAALQRRASVALELASSGLLDPAESVLLTAAAHDAREADPTRREATESDLTVALMTIFPDVEALRSLADPQGDEDLGSDLIEEMRDAVRRVGLAHAMHSDAVESTRIVRAKAQVRLFRLAGSAPVPQPFAGELALPPLD